MKHRASFGPCSAARVALAAALLLLAAGGPTRAAGADAPTSPTRVLEPMAAGKFAPNWESLEQYQCPEWFRDAKFGIWAHWSPQGAAEDGDWYAQHMYMEGNAQYKYHLAHYGHPSVFGYKDLCNAWKAEKFNPDQLLALYKRAGAQYFVALANHHDNFDCYDSKYQPWNSVNVGPKKDIVGMFAAATRKAGLRFGVSNHSSHTWSWLDSAYGHDTTGTMANVPYDGWLTKADGKGKWWEGLDPQDLYAGLHSTQDPRKITDPAEYKRWLSSATRWTITPPPNDQPYIDKWYNRTLDLINKYHPDLLYFDDTGLPMGEAGLKVAAHFYNQSAARNGGREDVVLNTKGVRGNQTKAIVLDKERTFSDAILPDVWQTDTCIGSWHYDANRLARHNYTPADTIIKVLVDNVSKNGNLLLSIPVREDGTIDNDELAIVTAIGDWMQINKESIFGTRPWTVFGEVPAAPAATAGARGRGRQTQTPNSGVRFATKGNVFFATTLAWPADGKLTIKALGKGGPQSPSFGDVKEVSMLGAEGALKFEQNASGLTVTFPATQPCKSAWVLKITK